MRANFVSKRTIGYISSHVFNLERYHWSTLRLTEGQAVYPRYQVTLGEDSVSWYANTFFDDRPSVGGHIPF